MKVKVSAEMKKDVRTLQCLAKEHDSIDSSTAEGCVAKLTVLGQMRPLLKKMQLDTIIAAYNDGYSMASIGAALGVSRQAVNDRLKRAGVK